MTVFENGDPVRLHIPRAAFQTVQGWGYYLAPNVYYDDYHRDWTEFVAEVIQYVLRAPVLMLGNVLLFATYNLLQRAEYLADGLCAQVSGPHAAISALHKSYLTPLIAKQIETLYPYRKNQDAHVFDVMAQAVLEADPEDVADLRAMAALEKQTVDETHPPTLYRVGFLETLGPMEASLDAADFDFKKIDAEPLPEADRLGRMLMQLYEDTTM